MSRRRPGSQPVNCSPAAKTRFAVPGAQTSWPAPARPPVRPAGNGWTSDQVLPRSLDRQMPASSISTVALRDREDGQPAAEVRQHEPRRRRERAVGVCQRHVHAGIAEADDVGAAVAGDVGEEARMFLDPPAASLEAEVGQHGPGRAERPIAVAERDIHPGVAEADDIGAAVAGDVGEEARVLVHPPAAGLEAEIVDHRTGGS